MLRKDKPLVVGMSPECKLFSVLQAMRTSEIPIDEWDRAVSCVRFAVQVAQYQRKQGRFFYFEHPLTASSWRFEELVELMS